MTESPTLPLGTFVAWTISKGPGDEYNYIPTDPDAGLTGDWGEATAVFGDIDPYRIVDKKVTARLITRTLNPLYNGINLEPRYIETIEDTYTESLDIDTAQRDQIHPAIELYDGASGLISVTGIIDGTYYVYPVVFPDTQFCYLVRCSGNYPNGSNIERCVSTEGTFPLEPYFPDCEPLPVYPMDAITRWSPSPKTMEEITYSFTELLRRLHTNW